MFFRTLFACLVSHVFMFNCRPCGFTARDLEKRNTFSEQTHACENQTRLEKTYSVFLTRSNTQHFLRTKMLKLWLPALSSDLMISCNFLLSVVLAKRTRRLRKYFNFIKEKKLMTTTIRYNIPEKVLRLAVLFPRGFHQQGLRSIVLRKFSCLMHRKMARCK